MCRCCAAWEEERISKKGRGRKGREGGRLHEFNRDRAVHRGFNAVSSSTLMCVSTGRSSMLKCNGKKMVPRLREFCYCCCLPLLPGPVQSNPDIGFAIGLTKNGNNKRIEPLTTIFY